MQKVQVFLRADQRAALRSLAARTGRKQSDLIRKGVDLLIEEAGREAADWRAATHAVAGICRGDVEEIQRELRAAVRRRFPVYD